jgi:Chalcone isomerase-like
MTAANHPVRQQKEDAMITQDHRARVPTRRVVLQWAALLPGAGLFDAKPARAMEIADTPVPDSYRLDGRTLILNGAALRTIPGLGIKIYFVALYLPEKQHDAAAILQSSGPKVAVVHYLHSGTKQQVQDRYHKGEQNNCGHGECDTSLQADFDRLVNAVVAVQPGDETVYAVTDKGLRVSFNHGPLQPFGQQALGNLIISGFIGPHAPTPEFRSALLGLAVS